MAIGGFTILEDREASVAKRRRADAEVALAEAEAAPPSPLNVDALRPGVADGENAS